MATISTDQYIVELILDDSQLQSSLQQLVKSGAIDQKMADAFKVTSAAIKSTTEAVAPLKKNLDDVSKGVKNIGASFSAGFGKGAITNINQLTDSTGKLNKAVADSNVLAKQKIDLSGKLTVSQTKEQAAYNKVVASLKTLTAEGQKSAKALLAFSPKQVAAGFEELGVSVDEYISSLQDSVPATASLRQELKLTTQAIAQLKLAGQDQGEVYDALVQKAGDIKDALADANQEIKNAGSDTRNLDNLLGTAQAVAGGFAAVQGAVGLFGDESEELQKTLLKVNSAMAILQGLQQIQNALQKEGAITLALANSRQKVQNAQLLITTALESKSVVVRGLATAAQWALNAAMAANPIGLLVTAVAGLVSALYFYNKAAGESERITNELNVALENATTGFDESAANIRRLGEMRVNELRKSGAKESDILKAQNETEKLIAQDRINQTVALQKKVDEAKLSSDNDVVKAATAQEKELRKLSNAAADDRIDGYEREAEITAKLREEDLKNAQEFAQRRALLAAEGTPQQLAAQKAAIDARLALELNAEGLLQGEIAKIEAEARREKEELDSAYRKRRLDGQIKDIETALINVEAGTVEEFNLRNNLIAKQTAAELENLKLSEKEKAGIIKKGQAEQAILKKNYDKAVVQEAIAAQVRYNNATLELIKTNDEDRLELQIDNIELLAGAEVEAAEGNASKIKEINAKRDADILAVRKQFILDAAEYERSLQIVDDAPIRRALEKRLNDQTASSLRQKKSAIDQLRDMDVAAIDSEIGTLDELYAQRLISDKDYELQRAQLLDDRIRTNEEAEEAITQTTKRANEQRTQLILSSAQAVMGIVSQIADIRTQKEIEAIEVRKKELANLIEAGAITEREAANRQKRIEAEERAQKRRQAVREKNLAIFDAVLNTAQGVTNAISTGDPYTAALRAAIVGAIGAAQIALISARPIPQFATGKTSLYEGMGKVGETGATEIIERDGRMYVVDKPTTTWIGKHDKVYNPHETKKILNNVTHRTNNTVTNYKDAPARQFEIDYEKQAKAFAKHIKSLPHNEFNWDKDGFSLHIKNSQENLKYWTSRYNSKGK